MCVHIRETPYALPRPLGGPTKGPIDKAISYRSFLPP